MALLRNPKKDPLNVLAGREHIVKLSPSNRLRLETFMQKAKANAVSIYDRGGGDLTIVAYNGGRKMDRTTLAELSKQSEAVNPGNSDS